MEGVGPVLTLENSQDSHFDYFQIYMWNNFVELKKYNAAGTRLFLKVSVLSFKMLLHIWP